MTEWLSTEFYECCWDALRPLLDPPDTRFVHVKVPLDGKIVRSGVMHDLKHKTFWKLDDPHDGGDAQGHDMSDDELLCHFCTFDEATFATQLQVPKPHTLPLFVLTRADDCDVCARASRLLDHVCLEPAAHTVRFPYFSHAPGCGVRYGDLIVCGLLPEATNVDADAEAPLRPVRTPCPATLAGRTLSISRVHKQVVLLVKATIPAGAFCVCVIVDGGDAPPLQGGNLVRVADTQVLLVLHKSLWKRNEEVKRGPCDAAMERVLHVPQPPVDARHRTPH